MARSSYIYHAYRTHHVGNPAEHEKAKARVQALLDARGFACSSEHPFTIDIPELGPRHYSFDLYAERGLERIDVEIDGESHHSANHQKKDALRDKNVEMRGVRVVRFNPIDINGHWLKNRLIGEKIWSQSSDAELLQELGL